MRIKRIELGGFGCLRDFSAEPAPGLNLFFGLNEAGKSTLQQAISALLYGFYDHDRAKPDETTRQERFRPWSVNGLAAAARYCGVLQYELSGGGLFEVRRDFSTPDVPTQLIDLVTGADLAPQYGRGRHGNIPFARRHLGMSRAVFQSCAFIAQGEVLQAVSAASPQEIGDAIAALADSSGRDVSAASAIARLDAFLQKLGSDRARTAELPKARESLRVAQAELEAHDIARKSVAVRATELQARTARMSVLAEQIRRLRAALLKARCRALERRLHDLGDARQALSRAQASIAGHAPYAAFPLDRRDEMMRLRERLAAAAEDAAETGRRLAEARRETGQSAMLEFETLRDSAGALTAEAVADLQVIAYRPQPRTGGRLRRVLRALLALVARFARRLLRRPAADRQPGPAAIPVSREEAVSLLERYHRYLALRPVAEAVQALERRLAEEQAGTEALEARMKGLLKAAGVEAPALETGIEMFLDGCRRRLHYETATAAAEEAGRRVRALLGDRSPEQLIRSLEESREALSQLLAESPAHAEVEPEESADELKRRLDALEEEYHRLQLAAARLDQEVHDALRGHRPRAEIEEDAEHWRREAARLENARAAAQTARDVINEAMVSVYRDFAPAVNSFLSDGFEYVTEGRYRRAHVDPETLRISLLLPETGRLMTDPPVSRGTLALAYILMRIGLARHMSSIGEPCPLLFDDPFVDVDERRLSRLLGFLLGVSGDSQILLFSKDPAILAWFERNAGPPEHRLHRISSAALAGMPL